ncbi:MAG TPA: transglutaminase family protein [Acidimicrobiales bacterium]|nr:transglutaminase family protein [Acidimicrobiales bacterium]
MAELAALALLDDRAVVWAEVDSVTYLLHQTYRYEYDGPVRDLRHRLMVLPPAGHGEQRRVDHDLAVRGCASRASVGCDPFGNAVIEVRADEVAAAVEFESWAVVRRAGSDATVPVPASALVDPRLLRPTPLTRPDARLARVARELAAAGGGALALAERVCAWTRSSLVYQWGVTTVRTTAVEALAGGVGVCQDYAHVMLAVCRAAGLPARYVSGHLVGEGGSHAWVEVVAADPEQAGAAVAVAFDPTHDRRAGWGYLTVAVGRDYTDVAPTSGRYEGRAAGRLTGSKRLGVVATEPAAGLVTA